MKRNMELIREILLSIEAEPAGTVIGQIALPPPYEGPEVIEHLRLIYTAGLLEGEVHFHTTRLVKIHIYGLSNAGHDLLDSIRDEKIWKATKEKIAEVGGSVAIAMLQTVATAMVKRALNL